MQNPKEYIGYRITHKTNERYYIGVVKAYMWDGKARARTCPHKGEMPALPRGYMGSGRAILDAILEHGDAAFDREILARFDNLQDAEAWERANVVMNDVDPLSYNINSGGKSGYKMGKKVRAKMSEDKTGEKNPNYGIIPKTAFKSGKDHPQFGRTGKDSHTYGKRGKDSPKYIHGVARTASGRISRAKGAL